MVCRLAAGDEQMAQQQAKTEEAATARKPQTPQPDDPLKAAPTLPLSQPGAWQRRLGNQALGRLIIQPKLTVNAVGDKYEQEADAVAKEVVQKLSAPQTNAATSASAALPSHAQRQTEEEEPVAQHIQRQEEDNGTDWLDYIFGWHLDRNKHNRLPINEHEQGWRKVPDEESVYHQPEGHKKSDNPFPNEKFLYRDGIGSFEAIRSPDGNYITQGPLQGTYNYVDPSGIFLQVKNAIVEKYNDFSNDPQGAFDNIIDNASKGINQLVDNPEQALGKAFDSTVDNIVDIGRDLGHLLLDVVPHEISDDYTEYDQNRVQRQELDEDDFLQKKQGERVLTSSRLSEKYLLKAR
jgi:hypothetical protein